MGDPKQPVRPRKGRKVAHPKGERAGTGRPDGKKKPDAVDDGAGEVELRLAYLAQEEEVVGYFDDEKLHLPLPTPFAMMAFQKLFVGYNDAVEKKDVPAQMAAIGTLVWVLQHQRDEDFNPAEIPADVGLNLTRGFTWRRLRAYVATLLEVGNRMTEVVNLSVRRTPEKGPDDAPAGTTPNKGKA